MSSELLNRRNFLKKSCPPHWRFIIGQPLLWLNPCLVQNVHVTGFDLLID
ncbi:Uncharacterised protein [Legionella lansingensis]|nr:Uncharacterised protein [Legionella lansingensis]